MSGLANSPLDAIYYNPAALADLKGDQFMIGGAIYDFPVSYRNDEGVRLRNDQVSFLQNWAYSSHWNNLSWGIGMYGSVGTGFRFSKDEDHGIVHKHRAQMGNLYTSPSIAYRLNDMLAVGAGINFVYGLMEMELPLGDMRSTETFYLNASGFALSGNVGLLFSPHERFSLGLRWRSRTKIELDGHARAGNIHDKVTVHLTWPDIYTAGLKVDITKKLRFLFDWELLEYSTTGEKSYFEYETVSALNSRFLPGMKDGYRTHFGLEYDYSDTLTFRAGNQNNPQSITSDQTNPLSPGNVFHTYHLGLGWKMSPKVDLDFALIVIDPSTARVSDSATGYNGVYHNSSKGFEFSLTYHFD